ncbi:MAG: VOC family protein [Oscillibacter sp.]|nr:VOC family protein [Oscillibacter sp.]
MKLGEVSILTSDVVRLANFYKSLLEIDNGSNDAVHQMIIAEETMLAIFNDGRDPQEHRGQNMCLAFTVDDIDKEYQRVQSLGAEIIEKPTARPWGAINMSFADPDGNIVYLRSFPKQ